MRSTRFSARLIGAGTALVLAVGVLGGVAPVASAGPNDPVLFSDSSLRVCINTVLGQPHGATVTVSQAQTLTSLSCPNRGIFNLTGLEAFTSLHTLELYANMLSSVTPLAGLTNLTKLDLYHNQVSSVTPLAGLTSLTILDLSNNQVSDVALLGGLTSLTSLNLAHNHVTNVSALAGLTSLNWLSLYDNQVSSVSALAGLYSLTGLDLSYNQISDVSPLAGLTSLTSLSLNGNQVMDASPLGGLTAYMSLASQSVVLPGGSLTKDYQLPVVTTKNGNHAVLSVSGGGYVINALAGTITFLDYGWYEFTWNILGASPFSGTLTVVVPPPGSTMVGSVTVSGGSSVGSVLTASVDNVFPSDATLSYQWLRAGEPIVGATASTYTLTTRDMCLQLSVQVTASKPGYTSGSKVSASRTGPVFSDVPSSHTFRNAICWAAQTGVTTGTGSGMFSPSDPVNRGSMAAFLYRMAGSPTWTPPATSPFTDVPKTHKFYKEITWLAASGITVGVTIGGLPYYQPNNVVNRGSMSAFMYRLSGSPTYTAPATSPFTDVPKAHTFYKTISWLASKNITAGTMVGGQLLYQPGNAVNRGSMAAFLNRLANQHLQCTAYPNGIQCNTG
ncbi:MAG: leucine-rich repeat domain-containing protein [Propionibacteriaceae bacterium]|jgi:hypothetical protein|nr:leucine-rich repeat domain-containing protein [Propionibacteriaceae bacterium]